MTDNMQKKAQAVTAKYFAEAHKYPTGGTAIPDFLTSIIETALREARAAGIREAAKVAVDFDLDFSGMDYGEIVVQCSHQIACEILALIPKEGQR